MTITLNGTSGINTPGVVNTAAETVATTLAVTGVTTLGAMGSSVITSGTAVASTSGTSIDFTSIPSWVKRITVMFNGVSLSGSAIKYIQLGTGGTPTTTGYSGVGGAFYSSNAAGATSFTSAFVVNDNTASAADSGHAVFTNVSGNIWVGSITMCQPTTATVQMFVSAGTVTLSGILNMVRITSSNGTDTFDAGSINILYE
jgi:hypothetical protein